MLGENMSVGLERFTHEDLRRIGEKLDKDGPKALGEKLLCFADDWRESLVVSDEQANTIALEIIDPWLNSDPCEGCNCDKVCRKMKDRIVAALMRGTLTKRNKC